MKKLYVEEYLDTRELERLESFLVACELLGIRVTQFEQGDFYGYMSFNFKIWNVGEDKKRNLFLEYETREWKSREHKMSSIALYDGITRRKELAFIKYEDGESADRLFEILYTMI